MSDVAIDQQRRFRTIALCFLVAVLEGYDIQAIGVAAPRLAPALGLSPDQLGLIFSISNIGLVIGALGGGWLADRLGRRTVLVASVIVFGVFTLATLLVTGFVDLFIVRLLTGFGLGAAMPNMMALAAEVSHARTTRLDHHHDVLRYAAGRRQFSHICGRASIGRMESCVSGGRRVAAGAGAAAALLSAERAAHCRTSRRAHWRHPWSLW